MQISNGRFFTSAGVPFKVQIDEARVRIHVNNKTAYARRLETQPHLWYDASHQRIMNAACELEDALRAAVEETT